MEGGGGTAAGRQVAHHRLRPDRNRALCAGARKAAPCGPMAGTGSNPTCSRTRESRISPPTSISPRFGRRWRDLRPDHRRPGFPSPVPDRGRGADLGDGGAIRRLGCPPQTAVSNPHPSRAPGTLLPGPGAASFPTLSRSPGVAAEHASPSAPQPSRPAATPEISGAGLRGRGSRRALSIRGRLQFVV